MGGPPPPTPTVHREPMERAGPSPEVGSALGPRLYKSPYRLLEIFIRLQALSTNTSRSFSPLSSAALCRISSSNYLQSFLYSSFIDFEIPRSVCDFQRDSLLDLSLCERRKPSSQLFSLLKFGNSSH